MSLPISRMSPRSMAATAATVRYARAGAIENEPMSAPFFSFSEPFPEIEKGVPGPAPEP